MELEAFIRYKDHIARELSVLMKENDCIILPGFGGFIGNYTPARFHPVTHLFQPPSKQLVFNRSLTSDDGLLANRLSKTLALSFQEARSILTGFSAGLTNQLKAGETALFPGIGSFNMGFEQTIRFTADEFENHLPAAFGLYLIQAQPINRMPVPERRPEPDFHSREFVPAIPVRKRFFARKSVRVLSAAAFVACLVVVNGSLPAGKGISAADINPFSISVKPSTGHSFEARKVNPAGRKALAPVFEAINFSAEHARIFIVAGCYSTRSNADGMVNYLNDKGFDSSILDRTPAGLYRVVYGSYEDLSAASEELTTIRKGLNEEAWLLIR